MSSLEKIVAKYILFVNEYSIARYNFNFYTKTLFIMTFTAVFLASFRIGIIIPVSIIIFIIGNFIKGDKYIAFKGAIKRQSIALEAIIPLGIAAFIHYSLLK